MSWPIAGGGVTVMWDWRNPGDGHGSGAVRQYHLAQARSAVIAQWQQAYANGQRRIALCTEYFEGGTSFHLDSRDGLCTQDKANLAAALADAKGIGFEHVMIETGPAWSAAPDNWMNPTVMGTLDTPRPFEPLSYGRNLKIVMDQYAVLEAAGLPGYGIDDHTEAIHGSAMDPAYVRYLQRWASDVYAEIGDLHRSGMSIVGDDPSSAQNIRQAYGDTPLPGSWLVHLYCGLNLPQGWAALKSAIDNAGLGGKGYLIGETFSDDSLAAQTFDADSDIFWWLSWPIGTNTVNSVQDRYATSYNGPRN